MILMYHNIGKQAGFNTVGIEAFKQQMSFVKENLIPVDMETYITNLKSGSKKPGVVISFDDAYTSFGEMALPELTIRNIPAIVYVPTDFVGKTNTWDEGKTVLQIMNGDQIHDVLKNNLVTLGAHGVSHRRISQLKPNEIEQEIIQSKNYLEKTFSRNVNHFSFPFGQKKDFNAHAIKVLKEVGFLSAVSTNYGMNNNASNLFSLNRIEVEPGDSLNDFKKKCLSTMHPKYVKQKIKNVLYRLRLL